MQSCTLKSCTFLLLALAACATPPTKYDKGEASAYTGARGASPHVRVKWIKHRGAQMHVCVTIKNESDHALTVKDGDIWLDYEGARGTQSRGEAPVSIGVGKSSNIVRKFTFPGEVAKEGTARVSITLGADGKANFELPVEKYVPREATAP